MKNKIGFTLIEILIVLAILAVLAGISYPSYQEFVIKARRTSAQSELIEAQVEQSSYHIMNPTYLSNAISAGLPSDSEYYTFSIVSATETAYLMKAEVVATSSQNNDKSACKALYIDQDNAKTSDGSTANDSCWID